MIEFPQFGVLETKGSPVLMDVRILAARSCYGRREYLVEPIAGQGQMWVVQARVKIVTQNPESV